MMALTRVTVSAEMAVLNDASAAPKTAATDATAVLTDPTALARTTVSDDNAPLNTPLTATNDTDAALNALDRDATALSRALVSLDTAVLNADTRDIVLSLMVMAGFVIISDAIFSKVLNLVGAPFKMF